MVAFSITKLNLNYTGSHNPWTLPLTWYVIPGNELTPITPKTARKKISFLMISGGIEVNRFSYIHLILEMKFGDDSLLTIW